MAVYDAASRAGREVRESAWHRSNSFQELRTEAGSPGSPGAESPTSDHADDTRCSSHDGQADITDSAGAVADSTAAYAGALPSRSLAAAEEGGLGEDPASWRFRRRVTSPHDDPDRREFYLLQLRVDDNIAATASLGDFDVCISATTLQSRPEVWLRGLSCDAAGRLLFPRAGPGSAAPGGTSTTALSPSDCLPWVTAPRQLLGQALHISVHRGSVIVLERAVNFNTVAPAGGGAGTSAGAPPPPPAHTRVTESAALRPVTAPAPTSVLAEVMAEAIAGGHGPVRLLQSQEGGVGRRRPSRVSPPRGSPGGRRSPTTGRHLLSSSTESIGAGTAASPPSGTGAGATQEVSPTTAKRQELARMREQMRASLRHGQAAALNALAGQSRRPAAAPAAGSTAPMTVTPIVPLARLESHDPA